MYARFLRRWFVLLLLGTLVGGAAAYVVLRELPSVYEATVTLMVQPADATALGQQDPQELAQTYAETAHTRAVLVEAAAQVGLGAQSASYLDSAVQVRHIAATQLLRISADDTDPVRAAALANAVAQVFLTNTAQSQAGRYASSVANLSQLADQLQQDMAARVAVINELRLQPNSPERNARLDQLQTALDQVRATHDVTLKSYADLQVSQARSDVRATIVDVAVPPVEAIRPNRSLTTLLAAIAGLVAATGLALLAEYRDDHLRDAQQVVERLGLPPLGVLPRAKASVSLHDPSGRQSIESYRLLQSRVSAAMRERGARSVLIASAVEGEGKSTVAANLALVLAEAGDRVILVDADIHRPAQMRLFELPEHSGLSNLVLEPAESAASMLQSTWVPTLRVLTAGAATSNPSAWLSARRATALLDELEELCDTLVIDTPALLRHPDGVLLSAHVGGVVFVVDARRTHAREAARALDRLRNSGANLLGGVINRASKDRAEYVP